MLSSWILVFLQELQHLWLQVYGDLCLISSPIPGFLSLVGDTIISSWINLIHISLIHTDQQKAQYKHISGEIETVYSWVWALLIWDLDQ